MTEIAGNEDKLPAGSHEPNRNVLLGDGYSVPLATYRAIHEEITNKKTTISKYYDDPFQLSIEDVVQLNYKFDQICSQYHIHSTNCMVTIFYVDNKKDQFGSFSDFVKYNSGQISPVESVVVKYNFLLVPPSQREAQSYSVSVRLASRLSIQNRMSGEMFLAMPKIIRIMGNRSAIVEIEYVDYMVARTVLGLIDDWFSTLPKARNIKIIEIMQYNSHLVPRIIRLFTGVIAGLIIIDSLPHFIQHEKSDLLTFGTFMVYSATAVFLTYHLASWSGRWLENSIDRWSYLSYLKFNKGDDIQISRASERNSRTLFKGIIALFSSILINIANKVAAALIIAHYHLVP